MGALWNPSIGSGVKRRTMKSVLKTPAIAVAAALVCDIDRLLLGVKQWGVPNDTGPPPAAKI
jgi:hypothetical protein